MKRKWKEKFKMGTQQILLIVLSVIIVGLAVAVGLVMFNQNAIKSNRNACIADSNDFATKALAWWRTADTQGGGNQVILNNDNLDNLGVYIGYGYDVAINTLYTANGTFVLSNAGSNNLQIEATGNETNNENPVQVILIVNLATGDISIQIIN